MEQLHHQSPLCKGEIKPAGDTELQEYLEKGVIEVCQSMQEKIDGGTMPRCPQCEEAICTRLAKSQHEDIYICETCGKDEANNDAMSIMKWSAVSAVLGNY